MLHVSYMTSTCGLHAGYLVIHAVFLWSCAQGFERDSSLDRPLLEHASSRKRDDCFLDLALPVTAVNLVSIHQDLLGSLDSCELRLLQCLCPSDSLLPRAVRKRARTVVTSTSSSGAESVVSCIHGSDLVSGRRVVWTASENPVRVGDSSATVPVVRTMPSGVCTHLASDVDSLGCSLRDIECTTLGMGTGRRTDLTDQLIDVDVVLDDPAT